MQSRTVAGPTHFCGWGPTTVGVSDDEESLEAKGEYWDSEGDAGLPESITEDDEEGDRARNHI